MDRLPSLIKHPVIIGDSLAVSAGFNDSQVVTEKVNTLYQEAASLLFGFRAETGLDSYLCSSEDMEFYDEKSNDKYCESDQSRRNNNQYPALALTSDKSLENQIFEDLISIVDTGKIAGQQGHNDQFNSDMLKSSTNQMSSQPPPYLIQSTAGQPSTAEPVRSPPVSVRSPPVSAHSSFLQHQLLGTSPPSRNTSIQAEIQQGETSNSNHKKLFYSSLGYTSVPGLIISERTSNTSPSGQGGRSGKSPVSGRLSCSPPIRSGIRRLSGSSPTRGSGSRSRRKSCEQKMSCSPPGTSLHWSGLASTSGLLSSQVPSPLQATTPTTTASTTSFSYHSPSSTLQWSSPLPPTTWSSPTPLATSWPSPSAPAPGWSAASPSAPASSWSASPSAPAPGWSGTNHSSLAENDRLAEAISTLPGNLGLSQTNISNRSPPSTSTGSSSFVSNGCTVTTLDRLAIGGSSSTFSTPPSRGMLQKSMTESSNPSTTPQSTLSSKMAAATTTTTSPSSPPPTSGSGGRLGQEFLTPLPVRPDNSILRQQLQGNLNKGYNNETVTCRSCGQMLTVKCIMGTCLKSDEVLCQSCNMELTVKCILGSCKTSP